MNRLTAFQKDFSLSAAVAGLITVLVGITSSAVLVFQAANAFGATPAVAGSWLGSLCIGMGVLAIALSLWYRAPVVVAWSTAGSVLLATSGGGFSMAEAIGAFLFSSALILLFGITGWFERLMDRIPESLTSALMAGILIHFCIDAFSAFSGAPVLVGSMFVAYLVGRRVSPSMTMLFVLTTGILASASMGHFNGQSVSLSLAEFHPIAPHFTFSAILSLGIPLFVVTMASQNLTGISVMRAYGYHTPISPVLSWMGATNAVAAFYGGFTINLAAITAAITMGPEAHSDRSRRYVAAVVSGIAYVLIGIFAGSITALFSVFPAAMITALVGFALLGTVSSVLEKALSRDREREAAFLTFIVAASGFKAFGIGSAFWAVVLGVGLSYLSGKHFRKEGIA